MSNSKFVPFKCVELFSGNADITKALNNKGLNCFSLDYDPDKNPDICCDVYKLTHLFFANVDFIWLSPDCTTYSIAQHGIHRGKGGKAVSDYARMCDENNSNLFELLKDMDIPFICENPRGHFRNMPFVEDLSRVTVYYSTYGAPYNKPTDLFSNCHELLKFFNTKVTKVKGHLDSVSYKNFLGRCKMPSLLIDDIVKAVSYAKEKKERGEYIY